MVLVMLCERGSIALPRIMHVRSTVATASHSGIKGRACFATCIIQKYVDMNRAVQRLSVGCP